jgi:hypothetical protein
MTTTDITDNVNPTSQMTSYEATKLLERVHNAYVVLEAARSARCRAAAAVHCAVFLAPHVDWLQMTTEYDYPDGDVEYITTVCNLIHTTLDVLECMVLARTGADAKQLHRDALFYLTTLKSVLKQMIPPHNAD